MKQKSLRIHCVFDKDGEPMREIVLRSFSLYLRRVLAENNDFAV